jgi:hypothetical protein
MIAGHENRSAGWHLLHRVHPGGLEHGVHLLEVLREAGSRILVGTAA